MSHDIPPPFKLLKPRQLDRNYTLSVVQNPIRARCCGFGEKDRRPIDPPPILQLTAENSFGEEVDLKPEDSVLFLVQCELYNENMTENRTLVYTPWSTSQQQQQQQQQNNVVLQNSKPEYVRNLIGSSVSNAYHLYNEENKIGTYFIFQDLSVRTEGTFTLKFVFIDLAVGEPLSETTPIQQTIFSTPFQVYPAKKFPGLTESTRLSRCFSKQGIKIPIRTDSPYKRISNTVYSDDHPSFTKDASLDSSVPPSSFLQPPPSSSLLYRDGHHSPNSTSTTTPPTSQATPSSNASSSLPAAGNSGSSMADHTFPPPDSIYKPDGFCSNSSTTKLDGHRSSDPVQIDCGDKSNSSTSNSISADSGSNNSNSTSSNSNNNQTPKYKRISILDVLSPD